MEKPKRPLFFQGVRDFSDFNAYLDEWLIPSTLGDLETLFEGATEKWAANPKRARGNFMLALALFAVMDHLGAFLKDPDDLCNNWKNISLFAERLPSLHDVHTVVAFCGRNALVHGAWPQTMMVIKDGSQKMRFGLNISAFSDITREHRKLYWKKYKEPLGEKEPEQDVLKFRLNVYALLNELGIYLRSRKMSVNPATFNAIKKYMGERSHFEVKGDRLEGKKDKPKKAKEWAKDLLSEIRDLYNKAPIQGHEITLPILDVGNIC